MSAVLLLLCILALCITSMDLALSIVYRRRAHYAWTGYLIVFIATSLGVVGLEVLSSWSLVSFSEDVSKILTLVWKGILKGDCAFLMVFIPFFTTWIIAHPWRQPYKTLFFLIAGVYLVIAILSFIFPHLSYLETLDYFLLFFVIFFCIVVLAKNFWKIEDRGVRIMCMTIMITGFSMLPVCVCGLFFTAVRMLSIPLFFIAFGIVILVFLFLALRRKDEKEASAEKKNELTLESLSEYHITEREFSVIGLIRQGLTNKEIASELSISVNTVNNHIANIFSKTGVRSRIDLLNLINEGW